MSNIIVGPEMTPYNLPSKFNPYFVGHPESIIPQGTVQSIRRCFAEATRSQLIPGIFEAGDWIFKGIRERQPDPPAVATTTDTHLYRVRKAEKIRKYIIANNLEGSFAVPLKYIYWNPSEGKFYVVCEKLELSEEVAECPIQEMASDLREDADKFGGQTLAYKNGKPQRAFTPEQARGLAELCRLGYTDLAYDNIFFTADGKVAIIDTEPVKRYFKKLLKGSWFFRLTQTMSHNLAKHTILGTAKLKYIVSNPDIIRQIETIERKVVIIDVIKSLAQVIFTAGLIYGRKFLPTVPYLLTIFKYFLYVRLVCMLVQITLMLLIWKMSNRTGTGKGVLNLLERRALA